MNRRRSAARTRGLVRNSAYYRGGRGIVEACAATSAAQGAKRDECEAGARRIIHQVEQRLVGKNEQTGMKKVVAVGAVRSIYSGAIIVAYSLPVRSESNSCAATPKRFKYGIN